MAAEVEAVADYRLNPEAFLRMAKYPLVASSDMPVDVKQEAVDVIQTACEKFPSPSDMEKCTQSIKEQLDKKFGPSWHVVVGRSFAFEVTHETKNMLYLYVGGTTGVLVWKL